MISDVDIEGVKEDALCPVDKEIEHTGEFGWKQQGIGRTKDNDHRVMIVMGMSFLVTKKKH